MDTGDARWLNRSSPSCLNSGTQRTDFFHGLLGPRGRSISGSIPACAGKPRTSEVSKRGWRVHPRVCGEALGVVVGQVDQRGPSPRVRGSHADPGRRGDRHGSIPACAGKPRRPRSGTTLLRVHPRVCGEARRPRDFARSSTGPSPRVRGSRRVPRVGHLGRGSIPACAGKPARASSIPRPGAVHPRVCGEAHRHMTSPPRPRGPSPRVRGSRHTGRQVAQCRGSIPACAGKPTWRHLQGHCSRVHPRVCGEAMQPSPEPALRPGPSPRVRGSRRHLLGTPHAVGSIPACAGKPHAYSSRRMLTRVHPRVCGEAGLRDRIKRHEGGPSPRVRGSRTGRLHACRPGGSIPACAGKPGPSTPANLSPRVHPRVCGEAPTTTSRSPPVAGPSPRVRGSPVGVQV